MGCTSIKTEAAEQILNLIYRHSNSFVGAAPASGSHSANLAKLRRFIESREEIHFVLPAFPAKSPNREKTLGAMPDMADLEGLRMLNDLAEDIRDLHSPGARILICSDGRVFADVVRVNDVDVENYKRGIERMIGVHALNNLGTFHLEDVFGELSFDHMREKLNTEYAVPLEDLREKMRGDQGLKLMFNGIHRFMFEDQLVLSPHLSREKARQLSKLLAYQVIQRSNAWSALLEARFPRSLRLSIHPQIPQSPKLGVRLVPAQSRWCTPWHNVLVSDGESKILMKRSEAEALGARLETSPEGYSYFRLRGALP
jgi:pyoverdine/dityrosine biosynthesis protein Dit1